MKQAKAPAAFLSYAHRDNRNCKITRLRERLESAVSVALGEDFKVFQDCDEIAWGQYWPQRLDEALEEAVFLIPILSPSYFASPHCCEELEKFLELEREVGRNDLILPIYFHRTPVLDEKRNPLATALSQRQCSDWRQLKYQPIDAPKVVQKLDEMADKIEAAIRRPAANGRKRAPLPEGEHFAEGPPKHLPTAERPPDLEPIEEERRVVRNVALRAEPSLAAGTVTRLKAGAVVYVAGRARNSGWLHVEEDDLRGYVVADAVEPLETPTPKPSGNGEIQQLDQLAENGAGSASILIAGNRALLPLRHNLTAPDYNYFVNYHSQIEDIIDALKPRSRVSVIKVLGFNGSGRSALVREIAQRCCEYAEQNPGSLRAFQEIIWASAQSMVLSPQGEYLRTISEFWNIDDLYLTVAKTLNNIGLLRMTLGERESAIQFWLRSMQGRCLFILDDVDQVSDSRLLNFLRTLPSRAKAIITARPGELSKDISGYEVPLDGLENDAALELLRREGKAEHVRAVEQATASELRELVATVDGFPLALRMAVAHLRDTGRPISWAVRWFARVRGPQLAAYCFKETAQSVRPPERRLLMALSVYPKPTTAKAAQRAGGISERDIHEGMNRLSRLRLVQYDERSRLYFMSHLVRLYAQGEVEADQGFKSDAALRAADYMCSLLSEHVESTNAETLRLLETQVDNMLWAARTVYDLQETKILFALRMCLGDFLYFHGYWDHAIKVGEWALHTAHKTGNVEEEAWSCLYPLARISLHRSNYPLACQWSRKSLTLFREAGNDYGIAHATRVLGRVAQAEGRPREARRLYLESIATIRRLRTASKPRRAWTDLQAHCLAALAEVAFTEHRYAKAQRTFENAQRLYQRTASQRGFATTCHHLGKIARAMGEHEKAERLLRIGLEAMEMQGWIERAAQTHEMLAALAEERADLAAAQAHLIDAQTGFERLSAVPDAARVSAALTRISAALAKPHR